ncbi:MAG: hypothetical protein LUD14_03260 [Clostridiales bacterium]|nr:hypothetical protein [Clostridiales bacterium]
MKRRMKKLLSLCVVVTMTASMSLASYAAEITDDSTSVEAAAEDTETLTADEETSEEASADVEEAEAAETTEETEAAEAAETESDDAEAEEGAEEAAAAEDAGETEEEADAEVSAMADSEDGTEEESTEESTGLNTYSGVLGSWSSGGDEDYEYTAGIFVYEDDYTTYSNPDLVESGTYDADSATDVVINDTTSGDNGIILYNVGTYSIDNASITLDTDADGTDTCDFSGRGTAIAVYGDSVVTISDSTIETTGVATMPIFADSGSTVTIDDSTLISNGGTLYGDYMNTPDQALMVAPPWILGIMGTSRCTNLMGNDSTMNVTDSVTEAGAWAVLSTDSGSNMYLNIYDTSLTLNNANESAAAPLQETTRSDGSASQLYTTRDNPYTTNYGSGYGTYVIGSAVETFAGATVNVGTYASIFTGGRATYTSIAAGTTYTLESASGNDVEYTATETKVTEINSDTFGFMVHQSPNYITIEEGTIVNSGYATFLVKSGSSNESVDATIDDAVISNGGVLIQVMDNDDATNGGMMTTDDEQNYNGSGMNFRTVHTENEGFNTEEAANGGSEQNFTFTNGDYEGNVYNASGSDNSTMGSLDASTLNLTLGTGATLTGAVASTAAIHVTYDGSQIVKANGGDAYDSVEDAAEVLAEQNTSFDATEYYSIGQVANLVNYNGGNDINVTLTDNAVWNVDGTSVIESLTVTGNAQVVIPDGVTLTVGDVVYTNGVITADGYTKNTSAYVVYESVIGSWSSGGEEDYQYIAALIVNGNMVDAYYSNTELISAGTYNGSAADGIEITDSESGHNGIIIIDSDYEITGAYIILNTDADGTDTCDFSGNGSAIAVYGDSVVTISDSYIETTGVATMPVFADSGATVTIDNSTMISNGGTLYGDYMNTPDQAVMVAPPWILGIMGTSRCTNLMGNDSTMNVTDSDTQAGAWAVLSTDSGSNMYLNIYDTSLTLNNADESAAAPLQETTHSDGTASEIYVTNDNPYTTNYGSGYGTYVIGSAVETFAGAEVNVGTYASIFTGGTATYTSIEAGETYTLSSATGENDIEYTATETKVTEINSDTFGFMVHQSPNYITIEEGTIVNSGYATFLVKSGSSGESLDATIDDAVISNGGVLIQVMDNDDATNGGMMSTDDEDNYNGAFMNFRSSHSEYEGFNTEEASNDGSEQNFTFTNGDYEGNVYNASGSDNSTMGSLDASTLNLTLGAGATLTGAVASTAAIHVTYDGSQIVKANGGDAYDSEEDAAEILAEQNTSFDMTEYYSIGQVANLVNYNGGNDINVTLTDDAVWYVDGTSVVSSLSVSTEAKVVVAEGVTLTVDGVEYGEGTYGFTTFPASTDDSTTVSGSDDSSDDAATTSSDDDTTTTTTSSTSSTSTAKTGDTNAVWVWIVVAAAALASGVAAYRKRRMQ